MKTERLRQSLLATLSLILFGFNGSADAADERVALVIGSNNYTNAMPLVNAISDARLVKEVLEATGFKVIALENPDVDGFYAGLDEFKREAHRAEVGLVYYAGHGVEVKGKNYLLPVDAELTTASQLRSQTVAVETILSDMEEVELPIKVVVLDCCRNNPLSRSWMSTRSVGRGLAEVKDVDLPEESLVVYSAGPGAVALDGEDENSPFTTAFATHFKKPGISLLQAFFNTSDDVLEMTAGQQEPWVKYDGSGYAIRRLVLVPESATPEEAKEEAPVVVGNSTKDEPAPTVGNTAEKESEPEMTTAATEDSEPQVGNTPEPETETTPESEEETKEETVAIALPSRGFFTNTEVFQTGPYESYNSYTQKKILRSAQGKLPGAGSADGVMGAKTQNAIQSYQESNELAVTGLLDEPTLEALELAGLPEETYVAPARQSTRSTSSTQSRPQPATQTTQAKPKKTGSLYQKPTTINTRTIIEKKRTR